MASLTNSQVNSKSMNGLINVEANSGTFDELDVNSLNILVSGIAPTVSALSNDTNIATTAWVTSHTGGSYVTIGTSQNITGEKIFSNANTFITGALNAPTIKTTLGTSMTISTDPVGYTDDIDITTANDLTLTAGFNAVLDCFQGNFNATNVMTFSSGTTINFNGVSSVFNGTNVSFNNTGGTTVFTSVLPSCSISATSGNDLVNKTTLDAAIASVGGVSLAGTNAFTGFNSYNTNLPTSTLTPSSNTQLTTKLFVDDADAIVFGLCAKLASNNTFTGTTNRFEGLNGVRSGTSTNYASLTQNGGISILNAFGSSTNRLYLQTNGSSNMTFGESGGIKYGINSGDFYNTTGNMFINQTNTTTGMGTTQIGYTVEDTSRSTDSANTQVTTGVTKNILSFTPLKGVWVASFNWKLTANTSSGAGQIDGWEVCLSETTASLTQYRSFNELRELNDAIGGSGGVRDKGNLSGVINADGATAYYINVNIRFSGLASPNTVYLAIPMLTYTKIG